MTTPDAMATDPRRFCSECSADIIGNDPHGPGCPIGDDLDSVDIAALLRSALVCLEHLTSDQFAHGGDRPARAAIVAALHQLGEATPDEVREYVARA